MSGVNSTTLAVTATGDQRIDGILSNVKWGGQSITYSFPAVNEYTAPYGDGENIGFQTATAAMITAGHFALNTSVGSAAEAGFSVEGFTNLSITSSGLDDASIRVARTSTGNVTTAVGYFPGTSEVSGDTWFGTNSGTNWNDITAGNYQWATVLHELGHTLGLEHAHENGTFGAVPTQYDRMEYTLMSYRSYLNQPVTPQSTYTNETDGYAQTFMMLDIAALQHMYGADFSEKAGNTMYKWSPNTGNTLVDGAVAINPGSNRIFLTTWDGGGFDIYDLRDYGTNMVIDLAPGGFSKFSDTQIANLGDGNFSQGNVYNALLYNNDTRSLIEAVLAGSGADSISGNQANNVFYGGQGNDTVSGKDGNDFTWAGHGNDRLEGDNGNDTLIGQWGNDLISGGAGNDDLRGGDQVDYLHGGPGNDILLGQSGNDRLFGQANNDFLSGGSGNDLLDGGDGSDFLSGETGNDTLTGGADDDRFIFRDNFGLDTITDFNVNGPEEKIDLSNVAAITDQTDLDTNHMFQVGTDVEIRVDALNIITVRNVTLAELQVGDDFLF